MTEIQTNANFILTYIFCPSFCVVFPVGKVAIYDFHCSEDKHISFVAPHQIIRKRLLVENSSVCKMTWHVRKYTPCHFAFVFSSLHLCYGVCSFIFYCQLELLTQTKNSENWGWGLERKSNIILSLTERRMKKEIQVDGPLTN